MNSQFLSSKTYLMKKFSIFSEQQLYFYLGKRFAFQNTKQNEFIHYIYFLSLSNERKILGDSAKFRVIELLNQNNTFPQSINLEQQISILIGLSNLLIYDEKIIESICEVIQSNLQSIRIRDRLLIAHCLQKLKMEQHHLFITITDQLNNQFEYLDPFDQIIYLLILTNLYHEKIVSQQLIVDLLKQFTDREKEMVQNYLGSSNYRFCQLIFNLFPEVVGQNYQNAKCSEQNQFYPYFKKLERTYKISRKVIEQKTGYLKADYFEYQNINFLKLPIEDKQNELTNLEMNVLKVLNTLNIKFTTQQRVIIYDVDFFLSNNTILNCNGPLHFIMNLQLQLIGYSLNHSSVIRHLKAAKYEIVDIEYDEWNKQKGFLNKQNYLKSLINII